MAAYGQPFPILLSILLSIPKSSSQQNIQTFYPFSTPPVILPPPPVDGLLGIPPTTAISRPSPPRQPSTRAAVGRAIGVTAASTLVISGLVFCLVLMYSNRKKEKLAAATGANVTTPAAAAANGGTNIGKFNGNLKGIIVDENGLDVLYWRNLEDEEKMTSFKKQYYKLKNEENEKKINVVYGNVRKVEQSVQEAPLLRGNSSTSQTPDWGEKDHIFSPAAPAGVTPGKDQDSPFRVAETSPPPPLPPGMHPALAASRSVLKGKMPVPETESSPVVHRMSDDSDSSAGQILAPPEMVIGASSNDSGPAKLKPNEDSTDADSYKFDGDLMEALFGYVATKRKSPRTEVESVPPMAEDVDMNIMEALFGYVATNRKSGSLSSSPSKVVILETRKSQDTAMAIESFGITHRDLATALLDGKGLNAETMEKVAKIAPSDEEIEKILAFEGDSTLADAESFLYHLLKTVPTAFTRLNAMLAKSSFESDISRIKQALNSLESACKEISSPGLFFKLLEAVHKAGNRLMSVEIRSRGDDQAFNLMFLRKLADVRSTDGKTTLLQFIIREVTRAEGKRCVLDRKRHLSSRKTDAILSEDGREREYMMLGLPVVGGLSAGFSNVAKSAALDFDVLVGTASSLAEKLAESRKMVARCGRDGGFYREMMNFLDGAELELRVIEEDQRRVVKTVKERSDFFHVGFPGDEGSGKIHLFVVVQDFLGMIDQICVEIARNSQKARPALASAAGSSPAGSHESGRVFRFPVLPADFMSEFTERSSDRVEKK